MKTCCCTIPFLDPAACARCGYSNDIDKMFIPFDPKYYDFVIGEDYYVIKKKERPLGNCGLNEEPADETEALKAENEMLKAEVEELKTKLTDLEAEKVKAETDLETMKKQTPKAPAIPTTPKVEMAAQKPFEQMTPLEQFRFKKELNK